MGLLRYKVGQCEEKATTTAIGLPSNTFEPIAFGIRPATKGPEVGEGICAFFRGLRRSAQS